MNVHDRELVIVRGINSDWFTLNFSKFWVWFAGSPQAIPKEDANYVGLYLDAPVSAITHIGIVESIERNSEGANFYLSAIMKLPMPIKPDHAIRKHEKWALSDFNLTKEKMERLRNELNS